MNTKFFFLALAFFAIVATGCSKKHETEPVIPLTLSIDVDYYDIYGSPLTHFVLEKGTVDIEILSGNGGYTLTPRTDTFYRSDGKGGFISRTYTINESDVKASIEGNIITFERINVPDVPYGTYLLSDSKGEEIAIAVESQINLGWL